ncbi:hypothetical protein JAO78_005310 [Alishewanella sp. 16-MA]|uniref:Uncharacterized protein n=1 Tax=Alishewanella maricola TaxID=2795740 RepID=A0ABS8C264_9ALTE|nr:hypothetical protein [Alishewanella maricola]MCB5226230.1 hypothetical protein [Alishewanella maricola]
MKTMLIVSMQQHAREMAASANYISKALASKHAIGATCATEIAREYLSDAASTLQFAFSLAEQSPTKLRTIRRINNNRLLKLERQTMGVTLP